jgi:hypothetical protein
MCLASMKMLELKMDTKRKGWTHTNQQESEKIRMYHNINKPQRGLQFDYGNGKEAEQL